MLDAEPIEKNCIATENSAVGQRCRAGLLLLLLLYAAGLTHGMSRPWTGMHDWNGAFFSQLARNLLRYPMSVHHGMGIVAVGDAVPPEDERSMYATHPPALIWLVAAAFRVLGEAEWVARLVPVTASLGSLALLVWLAKRWRGPQTAILAGLLYALMPMAVYFGRMVDHEAVCLFFMLAAVACWQIIADQRGGSGRNVLIAKLGWIAATFGAVWVDWCGVLFAGLFVIHVLVQFARGRVSIGRIFLGVGAPLAFTAAMLSHLVYRGLDGRWWNLAAVFLSRATTQGGEVLRRDLSAPGGAWVYTVENVTWPILLLAAVGFILLLSRHTNAAAPSGVEPDADERPRGVEGKWVLLATGVLWLGVFWRQYERHNYWLFYLGPPIAVLAADTLLAIRRRLFLLGSGASQAAIYALIAAIAVFALHGTDNYFGRVSYPEEAISAWRQIHAATGPDDRILLYRNPVLSELRGSYRFRNLIPPQQTYYLDRPFGVEPDFDAVAAKAPAYALYVVPASELLLHAEQLRKLQARFPSAALGAELVFNLHAGREASRPF